MVIDLNKCVGCYSCVVKCKQEHFLPPGVTWGKLLVCESGTYPNATKHTYPVLCNHCKEPACIEACPTNATQKREDGIVWVDQNKCIGCKHCVTACPYQVRTFHTDRKDYFPGQGATEFEKLADKLQPFKNDVVLKCDFCVERVEGGAKKGLKPGVDREATPACVNICPAKARTFGDLDDGDSEVSMLIGGKGGVQLHPGFGTDPSVYYILPPSMPKSHFLSRSSFPASAKYSLPLFLMTAKKAREEAGVGGGDR
ncbi:MAG: 4Fe-4S ferredoxin [Chloroflexi bacterium RBG_16_57_8]|nr:MAG: 4Fe-4S ferredoxin [Chloroflexi bacterium RBG_16_57_8]